MKINYTLNFIKILFLSLAMAPSFSFAQVEKVFCPSIDSIKSNSSLLNEASLSFDNELFLVSADKNFEDSGRFWTLVTKDIQINHPQEAIEQAQHEATQITGVISEYALPVMDQYFCTYYTADNFLLSAVSYQDKNQISIK